MRWKFKTKTVVLFALAFSVFEFSPLFVSALNNPPAGGASIDCGSPGLVPDPNTHLCLPPTAGQPQSVNELLIRIINLMLGAAFIIDLVFVVIGGYRYIFSNGQEKRATAGRETITNALIGLAVIVLAFVIVNLVAKTAGNLASNPLSGILPP